MPTITLAATLYTSRHPEGLPPGTVVDPAELGLTAEQLAAMQPAAPTAPSGEAAPSQE